MQLEATICNIFQIAPINFALNQLFFALVFTKKCTALSQSKSHNFVTFGFARVGFVVS